MEISQRNNKTLKCLQAVTVAKYASTYIILICLSHSSLYKQTHKQTIILLPAREILVTVEKTGSPIQGVSGVVYGRALQTYRETS